MVATSEVVDAARGYVAYTIQNPQGTFAAKLLNFGATLTHLLVEDKSGVLRDVVIGFDNPAEYEDNPDNQYFGGTVGRTANRTGLGQLHLNSQPCQLSVNNGPNHLHGGVKGFDRRPWTGTISGNSAVTFSRVSPHLEEGYPGQLVAEVTYEIVEPSTLRLTYSARLSPEQPPGLPQELETVVNLTHHSNFNLSGGLEPNILQHRLHMHATGYIPVDEGLIPTGEIRSVEDSPAMNFSAKPKLIGEDISQAGGYDHCYVLRGQEGGQGVQEALSVSCESTGITMRMRTTEPGVQFYSGNFLGGTVHSKSSTQSGQAGLGGQGGNGGGRYPYCKHGAFAVEAQKFPNAANQEGWRQQVVLGSGAVYGQVTEYEFVTDKQ